MERIMKDIPVTGTYYGSFPNTQLLPGTCLDLQKDPGNVHDKHAIKVMFRGRQLGWVSRQFNQEVGKKMAPYEPGALLLTVQHFNPEEDARSSLNRLRCDLVLKAGEDRPKHHSSAVFTVSANITSGIDKALRIPEERYQGLVLEMKQGKF